MATKKASVKVRPSDMSPELSVDYSEIIRAIYKAKQRLVAKFPMPDGKTLVHLTGRKSVRYSPTARSTHAKSLRSLDKAAEYVHELAKQAKVLEA